MTTGSEIDQLNRTWEKQRAAWRVASDWYQRALREREEADDAWEAEDCPEGTETDYQLARAVAWLREAERRFDRQRRQLESIEARIRRLDPTLAED